MLRMLIVDYVFTICPDRALCREVRVTLAHSWFCGLSIEVKITDHSAFLRTRNERLREEPSSAASLSASSQFALPTISSVEGGSPWTQA